MSVLYKSGMRQSYKCCPIHHPEGLTSHLYRFRGQCLLYLFLTNRHHTGGLVVVVVVVGICRRSIIITMITSRQISMRNERVPYYRYNESLFPTTTTGEECSGSGRRVPEKGHNDNHKDLYLHRHEYINPMSVYNTLVYRIEVVCFCFPCHSGLWTNVESCITSVHQ